MDQAGRLLLQQEQQQAQAGSKQTWFGHQLVAKAVSSSLSCVRFHVAAACSETAVSTYSACDYVVCTCMYLCCGVLWQLFDSFAAVQGPVLHTHQLVLVVLFVPHSVCCSMLHCVLLFGLMYNGSAVHFVYWHHWVLAPIAAADTACLQHGTACHQGT